MMSLLMSSPRMRGPSVFRRTTLDSRPREIKNSMACERSARRGNDGMNVPARANIIIVGGGAVGCSIAYHLAKLGATYVLLLERSTLTSGCTWHAAGLVGQLRSKSNLTRMMQMSAELYARIGDETGQDVGWHGTGSLRLASSANRWLELKRSATIAKSIGFEMHLLSPPEAYDKFPLLDLAGVVGATVVPSDG